MIVGHGADLFQFVDPNGLRDFQPFPAASLTFTMELIPIEGGAVYVSAATGYDDGEQQIGCEILQASEGVARAFVGRFMAYLKSQQSGLGLPVTVIFNDYVGRVVEDMTAQVGSAVVTSTLAAFNSADVGAVVTLPGAGPYGSTLTAAIASRTSTSATLTTPAATPVANGAAIISHGLYDGTWFITKVSPVLSTPYPGRIPITLHMRRAY